jgi:hypothetical protein
VTSLLAYIPFIDPLDWVHEWWYLLLIPMCFGIATIHKALRMEELGNFWREVALLTLVILLYMIGLAIAIVLIVQLVIPAVQLR